jgi:hypothetical protein
MIREKNGSLNRINVLPPASRIIGKTKRSPK